MRGAHKAEQECGCVVETQPIPRSMNTREVWTLLCVPHDAEYQQQRKAAFEGYRVTEAERALRKEFTT